MMCIIPYAVLFGYLLNTRRIIIIINTVGVAMHFGNKFIYIYRVSEKFFANRF